MKKVKNNFQKLENKFYPDFIKQKLLKQIALNSVERIKQALKKNYFEATSAIGNDKIIFAQKKY